MLPACPKFIVAGHRERHVRSSLAGAKSLEGQHPSVTISLPSQENRHFCMTRRVTARRASRVPNVRGLALSTAATQSDTGCDEFVGPRVHSDKLVS